MRLLLLSWDAARPGWLDPDVAGLAAAMVDQGAKVEVVSVGTGGGPAAPDVSVVWAGEAPPVIPTTDPLSRVLACNSRAHAAALRTLRDRPADVVVAHGWQTAYAAAHVRADAELPLVAVMPATELSRGGDLSDAASLLVHQIEWWLTYEARRVVARHAAGRRALTRSFRLPPGKVDVIPTGVAIPPDPSPVGDPPRVVVVAPATGPVATVAAQVLESLCAAGVPARRTTPGSVRPVEDDILVALDPAAERDVLGAMAAGMAVVVPDGGPLHALVHAGRSGLRVDGGAAAVADVVAALATDAARTARLGEGARRRARDRHAWPVVADAFLRCVRRAVEEEAAMRSAPSRPLRPVLVRALDLDD